jgi:hypothetical protein
MLTTPTVLTMAAMPTLAAMLTMRLYSSAKVRAMLAYKRIPFTDLEPSLEQLKASVAPNVGRVCMPAVKLEQAAEQQCGKDTAAKSPFARREKRSHSEWWRQVNPTLTLTLTLTPTPNP